MKNLEKLLLTLVVLCAFVTTLIPLVVTTEFNYPYITGKNFLFRILAEIMFASWLGLTTINKKYYPRHSWILGAFTLFLLIIGIADWQGVNPSKSFWGNFERMEGFVTLIHLYFYIIALSSTLQGDKIWRRFFQFSLIISAGLSCMGIYESFQLGERFVDRITLSFGNPSYVATYMIFHIFIALILISRKTIVPYGLILFLNLVGFTLASTRGAFLGLVFGTALSIFLFVFFYLKPSKKTILIYSAAISTVITLSCCVFVFTDSELYWPIKRLINISSNDPAILARLHNIGIALQGIQERPWLGWGQENYEVVFNRYFDPRLVTAEPWFDRVHNHIFDWAIAGGILGLFGYISIFVAALWVLWKNKSFNIKEQCLVTGVFFSYFVNNLALFDTITSYLMFAILLSWLISKSSSYPKHSLSSGMPYLRAFACSTIAFILIYSFNLKPFTQLQTYSRGLITSNLNERLALFDDALKTHSLGQKEIAYYLCSNAFELVLNNSAPIRTRQKYHEKCQEQLLFLQDKEPLNMVIPLYLGIQQTILGNPEAADTFLSLAHELSPKKQIVLWEMARNNELALNNPEKAEKLFKKAFELYEDAPKSRTMYGAFLVRQGQDQQAESILKPLIANGQAAAPEVLEAYRMRGNESKITELLHK